jgi:hypothetical protein
MLTPEDLAAIRTVVRDEIRAERAAETKQLANAPRAGRRSTPVIGASVERIDRWTEETECESMDPIHTATDGASRSPDQIAARLLSRSRQRQRPSESSPRRERKLRGGR